jgi:hypothetical protein
VLAPKPTIKLKLPSKTLQTGVLSSVQLEAILLASQKHAGFLPGTSEGGRDRTRAGFFMGDGAGMGKGRQIAAVITDNWLRGRRKAVWISVSADLKLDAERDLRDIGSRKITTHDLKDYKLDVKLGQKVHQGLIFLTYRE